MTIFNSPVKNMNKMIEGARENVILISAFLTADIVDTLPSLANKDLNKILLIRGNQEDFLNGSSSLSCLEEALSLGWKIYINEYLHAKLYCVDWKEAIIGSSNFTNRGLSTSGIGNIELNSVISITENDKNLITQLLEDSFRISFNELNLMKEKLNDSKSDHFQATGRWDFEKQRPVKVLFPDDIFEEFSNPLSEYNENLLTKTGYISSDGSLKDAFTQSNEYRWLLNVLKSTSSGTSTFGYISSKLHDSMISNSRIYRKDIKKYLSDLVSWLNNVSTDIVVDRNGHTDRFRLMTK